jgi:phage-related protein (TIGR01555 family)
LVIRSSLARAFHWFKPRPAPPAAPLPISVAELKSAQVLKITPEIVSRARASKAGAPVAKPFEVALHPPGVTPEKSMALDDALQVPLQWAAAQFVNRASEGTAFLGFPFLAELTLRTEYRRATETVATEATRKWVKLTSVGGDKEDKIAALNAAMTRFDIKGLFFKGAALDGYFGRGHLFIDLDAKTPDELKTDIGDGSNGASVAKIKKGSLKGFKTVEPVWVYPIRYNATEPLSPDWYKPTSWSVQGKEIHASRLLTFISREVPDMLKPAYSFGGLSLSQMIKPYVDNWVETRQNVSDLIGMFSTSGIKTDLANMLLDGDGGQLQCRTNLYNAQRENAGIMILNKETEDFFNVSVPLGGLDKLQAQALEHICSASGIPLVKFTGISPSGLNATSEGELEAWYTWVHAYQETLFAARLKTVLNFLQLNEFGAIDPDIGFAFEPLWSMSEKELADVEKVEADTDAVLIDKKVITAAEARKRVAGNPDSPYSSIDPEAAPVEELTTEDQADIVTKITASILEAYSAGLLSAGAALTELQSLGEKTGVFKSITPADIAEANIDPPAPEESFEPTGTGVNESPLKASASNPNKESDAP